MLNKLMIIISRLFSIIKYILCNIPSIILGLSFIIVCVCLACVFIAGIISIIILFIPTLLITIIILEVIIPIIEYVLTLKAKGICVINILYRKIEFNIGKRYNEVFK